MEKDKPGTTNVGVDCFRQSECPKGEVVGDGSCFELKRRAIVVPFDLNINDWVSYLNNAEPLQKCQLGYKRYRIGTNSPRNAK